MQSNEKALANMTTQLKSELKSVVNAVQGKGVRIAGDGVPKGDSPKGAKAKGKGKGLPAFEVQYPADI